MTIKIAGLCLSALLLTGCHAGEEPAKLSNYEVVRITESATIDCKGKLYNEGKITEIQIVTTKNSIPTGVTIKRCRIN